MDVQLKILLFWDFINVCEYFKRGAGVLRSSEASQVRHAMFTKPRNCVTGQGISVKDVSFFLLIFANTNFCDFHDGKRRN